jgi:hypothetical protein
VVITKIVGNKMAARIQKQLKFETFNANDIWRQRYVFNKQLQGLHINVTVRPETRLEPPERFFIPNYHFYRTDSLPGRESGTAFAVRREIPHNHVDLSAVVSVEATRVCIPIGSSEFATTHGTRWRM